MSDGPVVRLRPCDLELSREPELTSGARPPALAPGVERRRSLGRIQRWLHQPTSRLESDAHEPPKARLRDRRYRRLLALADVLAMALALGVCIPLLGNGDTLTPLVAAGAPLIVALAKVLHLYDRDELLLCKTTLDEIPKLFQVATLMALLLWLGHGFLIEG